MKTIQEVKDFFFNQFNAPGDLRQKRCRVLEELARELLLNNETIILNGKVYWFAIRRIGLGVCEIALAYKDVTCLFE